jgi:hypothetical protein
MGRLSPRSDHHSSCTAGAIPRAQVIFMPLLQAISKLPREGDRVGRQHLLLAADVPAGRVAGWADSLIAVPATMAPAARVEASLAG